MFVIPFHGWKYDMTCKVIDITYEKLKTPAWNFASHAINPCDSIITCLIFVFTLLQLGLHLCRVCNGCWKSSSFNSLAGDIVFMEFLSPHTHNCPISVSISLVLVTFCQCLLHFICSGHNSNIFSRCLFPVVSEIPTKSINHKRHRKHSI